MAADALREAMRQAETEKTGEVLLKPIPMVQAEYPLWRNGLLSSPNRCAPKAYRTERDEYIEELNDSAGAPNPILVLGNDHVMKALDESLYDAIQQVLL